MPYYHAILTCSGLTEAEGVNAPADIIQEFGDRPWHQNVKCRWDGKILWLEADNDYDADGLSLLDEFWDVVIAYVNFDGEIHFEVFSVEAVVSGS